MNRAQFFKTGGLISAAAICLPNTVFGQEDKPAQFQKDLVSSFVGASHSNLDKVKALAEEYPNLIYSSTDWGGGDFESAMEAAGHVGRKDIVEYLIGKGARPSLHALAMMGKSEIILPLFDTYPNMMTQLGAHGFTFLHYAQRGKEDAVEIVRFLEDKGMNKTKVALY